MAMSAVPTSGRLSVGQPGTWLVLALTTGSVLLFVLYPLWEILSEGFFNRQGEFSMAAYISILTRPVYQTVIYNTLILGTIAACFGSAVGFLYAYTLVRVRSRLGRPLRVIALLPLVSPPFAVGMAIILLFGRSGLITRGVLGIEFDIYGLRGLALVQIFTFFPVAFLIFESLLKQFDASMEEAAQSMGAGRWHIFRTVTLPLMLPGIAGSLLVIFIESLADLANPILIGGNYNVLASQSWIAIIGQSNFQLGAAFSVILLLPSLVAFIAQRYWLEKRSFIAVTGKPTGGRIQIESPFLRGVLLTLTTLVAAFVVLLYCTILFGALTRVWGADYSLTLEHFFTALDRRQQSMIDTTMLAAIATPLTAALSLGIAYLVVRRKFFGRGALDFTSMMGAAVPGTVLGIGFILAFNNPPIHLTGTWMIVVACFMVRALPAGLRATIASLQQIDPSIEEASTNLGANGAYTLRRITLPLVSPALLAGMLFSFARNMTALSAIIFLVSPRWKIMTKEILDFVEQGYIGEAIALITVLMLIVFAAMALMTWLVNRAGQQGDIIGLEGGR
jgi:iron(III) transport system permease protein